MQKALTQTGKEENKSPTSGQSKTMSNFYAQTEADYVYKRCYIDKQGNYINPKTTWDDLLKYYRSWVMLLSTGDGTRRMAKASSSEAARRINSEQKHKKNQAKATNLQSKDLATKDKKRKKKQYRKIYNLETEYLKQVHDVHNRRYRS